MSNFMNEFNRKNLEHIDAIVLLKKESEKHGHYDLADCFAVLGRDMIKASRELNDSYHIEKTVMMDMIRR